MTGRFHQSDKGQVLVTALVVVGACAFVLRALRPDLLWADTTMTLGDAGAHVWGPAYLRDHLLPHGRLSGWAPDWYAGFPWLTFYFPIPSLLVVLVDLVLPYTVAFKLVTVLGVVALPAAAWAFGRLSGMPAPGPACLAVATLPFLFDHSFAAFGGNLLSTVNGEFAYAVGLSLALVFLGVFARGLATDRGRALAAALLALVGLAHVVTAFFAVAGALVLTALRHDRRSLRFTLPVGAVAGLLAAFWTVPFLLRLPYTNDLGWLKITDFEYSMRPAYGWWTLGLAAVGAVASVLRRNRTGTFLAAMAVVSAAAFVLAPQSRLWNGRLLPFWLLGVHLLTGVAVAEGGRLAGRALAARRRHAVAVAAVATPAAALVAVAVLVSLPLGSLPSWFPLRSGQTSVLPEWVASAYGGYERAESYPEYKDLVDTMERVGRTEGCGRAMWEYGPELDRLGTTMGLMLLPYWTDGCIASMEGLFFESSATTPYHFLNQSELSRNPSQPQRDLPYRELDVAKGVEHLRLLGVRYYIAFSDAAKTQARQLPSLRLVASSGPWDTYFTEELGPVTWEVYEVDGSDIVAPLEHEPVVMQGVAKGGREWQDAAVGWYQDSTRWPVPLAASGPREWQRARGADPDPPRRRVAPATVSSIRADDDSISFDVDRVGSPVLVKASYFPNWQASGARGPWRVTPNQMVVVPTERHVTLRYGTTPVDVVGRVLSLLGLVGLVVLWRRDRASAHATTVDASDAVEGDIDPDSDVHHPAAVVPG